MKLKDTYKIKNDNVKIILKDKDGKITEIKR